MDLPTAIQIQDRTYRVVPGPRKVLPGHIYIKAPGWLEPSPFRWPTFLYAVTWAGDKAVLESRIKPSVAQSVAA